MSNQPYVKIFEEGMIAGGEPDCTKENVQLKFQSL